MNYFASLYDHKFSCSWLQWPRGLTHYLSWSAQNIGIMGLNPNRGMNEFLDLFLLYIILWVAALRRADPPFRVSCWLSTRFIAAQLILNGNRSQSLIRQDKKRRRISLVTACVENQFSPIEALCLPRGSVRMLQTNHNLFRRWSRPKDIYSTHDSGKFYSNLGSAHATRWAPLVLSLSFTRCSHGNA
jgi:hypothetical protein